MPAKRRDVLKSIGGGVGVSAGVGITTTSVVGEPSPEEVEIVTVRSGEKIKETATVSRRWWEHVQTSRRVRKELGERYKTVDEVKSLSRAPSKDDRIHDRWRTHVRVYVEDIDSVDTQIPDVVNGIDIRTLQYNEGELHSCNQTTENPLPGGIQGAGNSSSCGTGATWCCRLRDPDTDEKYMLHCAHAFDACDDTQYDAKNRCNKVGELLMYSGSRDAAITEQTSYMDIDGYSDLIKGENHGRIKGHLSENGIENLLSQGSDGEKVYKMGMTTCKTEGYVKDMNRCNSLNCGSDICEYVGITNASDSGDSGGPYYQKKWDPTTKKPYIAMVGTHSRALGDGAQGIASYEIYNWTGLHFD